MPSILDTRPTLPECDFNLHKSNSTYFTDLDIARSHLSGILFGPLFFGSTPLGRCNLVVGAVSCVFRKEIKPYQPCEVWTKVASWDEKWIYMANHFVPQGTFRPQDYISKSSPSPPTTPGSHLAPKTELGNAVLASAITRMVFKKGRLTVSPADALEACGLLPGRTRKSNRPISPEPATTETTSRNPPAGTQTQPSTLSVDDKDLTFEAVDIRREAALPITRLQNGWDAVHGLFQAEPYILARHKDFI